MMLCLVQGGSLKISVLGESGEMSTQNDRFEGKKGDTCVPK